MSHGTRYAVNALEIVNFLTERSEVAEFSDPQSPHYQYFDVNAPSYLSALDQLEAYINHHGPFDGILGFSQGAGFALMHLIRHCHLHASLRLPFKVAILFSRAGVYDPAAWLETGQIKLLTELPQEIGKLNISVVETWGANDLDIVKEEVLTTQNLVRKDGLWSLQHCGGHDVPGPHIEGSVQPTVRAIRRAIAQSHDLGNC
jgi:hypothetical protein